MPAGLSGDDNGIPFSFIEELIFNAYGISDITIPEGYPYETALFLVFPPYCNATSNSVTLTVSGDPVSYQSVQYGPTPFPAFIYGSQGIGGIYIIFPDVDINPTVVDSVSVTLTVSNSCSSESGESGAFCFLAGSPVAIADGTSKPIEQVVVGDHVIGAFGEINTVTGTLSNLLGLVSITNINGEHKTTAPHPHITVDHKLSCTDTVTLALFAYGKSFHITGADGRREKKVIRGVSRERITKLQVGTVLQTLTGPRTVTTLETIRMPASTRVYHLTTDGSHSYTVDGYAVAGGATEEDFNYDTWTPRA